MKKSKRWFNVNFFLDHSANSQGATYLDKIVRSHLCMMLRKANGSSLFSHNLLGSQSFDLFLIHILPNCSGTALHIFNSALNTQLRYNAAKLIVAKLSFQQETIGHVNSWQYVKYCWIYPEFHQNVQNIIHKPLPNLLDLFSTMFNEFAWHNDCMKANIEADER